MPELPAIPKTEPWLAGYVRRGDADLEPARERARRAAAGEAIRRRHNDEPSMFVRTYAGTTATTGAGERVVTDQHGRAIAKDETK